MTFASSPGRVMMTDPNPYEPPKSADSASPSVRPSEWLERVAWSICCLLAGLAVALPFPFLLMQFLAAAKVVPTYSTMTDSYRMFAAHLFFATFVTAVTGMIAGASRPGLLGLAYTLVATIFSNLFSAAAFWQCRDEAALWPVFLVAAILNGSVFAVLIWREGARSTGITSAMASTDEIRWDDEQ